MTIFGIDYASVDGNPAPAWPTVIQHASFAYIRGTWGTYTDPDLARDHKAATDAGLAVGAYMFLRFPELGHPAPSPEDQVAAFVAAYAQTNPKASDLPPALDVEFPGRGRVDTGLSVPACLDVIGRALGALEKAYGVVAVYTSARVWEEDLGNAISPLVGAAPLWVKTPYVVRARQAPVLGEVAIVPGYVPPPWHGSAWIQQYQGDAIGFPGFSGTVDVNRFLPATAGASGYVDNTDPRAGWVHARLGGRTVRDFQDLHGLTPDGVVGPRTFAVLCRVSAS